MQRCSTEVRKVIPRAPAITFRWGIILSLWLRWWREKGKKGHLEVVEGEGTMAKVRIASFRLFNKVAFNINSTFVGKAAPWCQLDSSGSIL